jgi:hypothetical protein
LLFTKIKCNRITIQTWRMHWKGYLKVTREPYFLHRANSSVVMAANTQPHYGWNIICLFLVLFDLTFTDTFEKENSYLSLVFNWRQASVAAVVQLQSL